MLMPYLKTVSLSACLLSLTGLYGCQSAQQKVYQQASRSTSGYYYSTPMTDYESSPSRYNVPDQFSPAPEPEPSEELIPPAAPPSLIPPEPEKTSFKDFFSIKKVSQQQVESDLERLDSESLGDSEEPAQKYLGLVPRYSTASDNTDNAKLMNGRVKGLYAKMKSHIKSSGWFPNYSGKQEELVFEDLGEDISCIESAPSPEEFGQPEELHSVPVLPSPEPERKKLPTLPPPGETTYWDNSWSVSATLEQLPVSNSAKNYSTQEDYLEAWPFSNQRMQREAQLNQQKKTPVSIPGELSVPTILSEENSESIRKINLQRSPEVQKLQKIETLEESPIVITPRKIY